MKASGEWRCGVGRAGLAMLAIVLLGTAVALGQDETAPESGSEAVARIRAFTRGLDSLQAEFVQILLDAEGQMVQESEGRLSIKRPDRFRWDYTTPYEQLVLADGERIWSYDSDLEQAVVRDFDAALAASPAMLLGGTKDVEELYRVLSTAEGEGTYWVTLEPLSQDTDFRFLTLGFEADTLRAMELKDKLDQVTRIRFTGMERNPELDEQLFVFEPPPGVDVIGDLPD